MESIMPFVYNSKEEFISHFAKYEEYDAERLLFQILAKIKNAVSTGNVEMLMKFKTVIDYIIDVKSVSFLYSIYNNKNGINICSFVVTACKYNEIHCLKYIFDNLKCLVGMPSSVDECGHNAFYYAIRSANIELLNMLIDEWPDNYLAVNSQELDEILSAVYEELKLINVPLSDEMEISVEQRLLDLRFFSSYSGHSQTNAMYLAGILERIDGVLEDIQFLETEYAKSDEIDEKFLHVGRIIARNIHILKRQLKSTYKNVPWEEMEFCLVHFIFAQSKREYITFNYNSILNKSKVLHYLNNFATCLINEKDNIKYADVNKLGKFPSKIRKKIVINIIGNFPSFKELYENYEQLNDVYSLNKMCACTKLASNVTVENKEGQLIIIRALQVIGEHLKNTLESPKLSDITMKLLLSSLSGNMKEIILHFRNSISHACLLSKRMEIEEESGPNFFLDIQNDIKKVNSAIVNIIHNYKINFFKMTLKKIYTCTDLKETQEIIESLRDLKRPNVFLGDFVTDLDDEIKCLIQQLNDKIGDKTYVEEDLFSRIDKLFADKETIDKNIALDSLPNWVSKITNNLQIGVLKLKTIKSQVAALSVVKYTAGRGLQVLISKTEPKQFDEIVNLLAKIFKLVVPRIKCNTINELRFILNKIYCIINFKRRDIKSIEGLKTMLNINDTHNTEKRYKNNYITNNSKYTDYLKMKLSTLRDILNDTSILNTELKYSFYKNNKPLQAAVEMLVLDVMSILSASTHLKNNLLFLDDNLPLLTGKYLRNYLAHDNTLMNILLSSPLTAIFLNANKLVAENPIKLNNNNIGAVRTENSFNARKIFKKNLITIDNKKEMIIALEEGNFRALKNAIKKGADINGRTIDLWSMLHFAAKGGNIDIVKFILHQNLPVNVKNSAGQTPVHVAAMYGAADIIELFIKGKDVNVDEFDNRRKTALHIAAEHGSKSVVEILLKKNANAFMLDIYFYYPIHYAVENGHKSIVEILLARVGRVDDIKQNNYSTLLHLAALNGHRDVVNLLLHMGAYISAKNYLHEIPLHMAALGGHFDIVKVLISNGANVTESTRNGCTPLQYAALINSIETITILLENKANVNCIDKGHLAPISHAAMHGHKEIVELFFAYKADANISTLQGLTALHFAAMGGHRDVVDILIKHNASLNAKDINGFTALHFSADGGYISIVELLIKQGALVDVRNKGSETALHMAARKGHCKIVDILIKNGANVNAVNAFSFSPLVYSSQTGFKNVGDILLKNGAEINLFNISSLHTAVMSEQNEFVQFLLEHNADVDFADMDGNTALHFATTYDNTNIVALLIKKKAKVNVANKDGNTPLHCATLGNNKKILKMLMHEKIHINVTNNAGAAPLDYAIMNNNVYVVDFLLKNGADITIRNNDSLILAICYGHEDIVELISKYRNVNVDFPEKWTLLHIASHNGKRNVVVHLLQKGTSDINAKDISGYTALHIATREGHIDVIEALLINGADVNIKDNENIKVWEFAVMYDHTDVVKLFVETAKFDINEKGDRDFTLLHIAAQRGNLELIKYLVDKGANINARNALGSKPAHIAARKGFKDIVEFFLSNGFDINDVCPGDCTLLVYAIVQDRNVDLVNYLINKGMDINLTSDQGISPVHMAALNGREDILEILLFHGAIYNGLDAANKKPLDTASNGLVIDLLTSVNKLFQAIKRNDLSEVKNLVENGAPVNAKDIKDTCPLHYSVCKGYTDITNVLLVNKGNPNVTSKHKHTPLHCAVKFQHFEIVKMLLSHGAVYNPVSDYERTPLEMSSHDGITNLLKLVGKSFKNVQNDNMNVINILKKTPVDIVKAVMNARNREGKKLIIVASHNHFRGIDQLNEILEGDVSLRINTAMKLCIEEKYSESLCMFNDIFERRKEILGSVNPATLTIQHHIGNILIKQRKYTEALKLFNELYEKRREISDAETVLMLDEKSTIALLLYYQGKNEEALTIYKEIYTKQKDILGLEHRDILSTRTHMAIILNRMKKHEEALQINYECHEMSRKIFGLNHPETVNVRYNLALILMDQGENDKALTILKSVYSFRKRLLGPAHPDTLKTVYNSAKILVSERRFDEALKTYTQFYDNQKFTLNVEHLDVLNMKFFIADIFVSQGRHGEALQIYEHDLEKRKEILGPSHSEINATLYKIKHIRAKLKAIESENSNLFPDTWKDFIIAVHDGNAEMVGTLIGEDSSFDINAKDCDGRTALHIAINNGHQRVVGILLENKADATAVTNKGNTPLHTAAFKNYDTIVESLLMHVKKTNQSKFNGFINGKTALNGTTAFHVAAKIGSWKIVKDLLKFGAIYNPLDNDDKTPLDYTKNQVIADILKLIDELFGSAVDGIRRTFSKLYNKTSSDKLAAILNARNRDGLTLIQLTSLNNHKFLAQLLVQLLQKT